MQQSIKLSNVEWWMTGQSTKTCCDDVIIDDVTTLKCSSALCFIQKSNIYIDISSRVNNDLFSFCDCFYTVYCFVTVEYNDCVTLFLWTCFEQWWLDSLYCLLVCLQDFKLWLACLQTKEYWCLMHHCEITNLEINTCLFFLEGFYYFFFTVIENHVYIIIEVRKLFRINRF